MSAPTEPDRAGLADESAPAVPPVVVVIVTHDAGSWLEETLAAVGASDYPNLSVLVVDAASAEDPTSRIAAVLPSAYVRRLATNPGFGAAANDVLSVVEGASHYVFLHDDAAPEPDAIRLLVEEAYRSNAGIVAPKLVDWHDPRRLLAVGMTADKTGVATAHGRGELDQEQHDAVRDVFGAPGGCQLVRADLFETLGGFDAAMPMFGEDLDISWRAQVAGARVVVAPSARVRHLEATVTELRDLDPGLDVDPLRLRLRHRVRSVLKSYGPLHLIRVLPQLAAVMLVEAIVAGRAGWRALIDATRWNASGWGAARKDAQRARLVPDSEVRRLQSRGIARLTAAVRGGLEVEERTFGVGAAGRELAGAISRGGLQLTVATWLTLFAVLLFGSRHLLTGSLAAVGQFQPFPGGPGELFRLFASGWRAVGLGSEAPAPFSFALLGAGGVLTFGGMGLLQKIMVLGALPVGIVGAHRMTAPLQSWRPRLLAAVLYAAVPLPYDAISRGRWSALIAYAAMPWLLGRLLRASGLAPFGAPAPDEANTGTRRRSRVRRRQSGPHTPSDAIEALLGAEAGTFDAIDTEELRLAAIAVAGRHDRRDPFEQGEERVIDVMVAPPSWVRAPGPFRDQAVAAAILVAVTAAFAPGAAVALLVVGIGLLLGSVLAGPLNAGARSAALAAAAVGGAAVLMIPWTFDVVLPGARLSNILGMGPPPASAPGFGELLALHTGPTALGPLALGLLVAAALPLAVGRSWRFDWAVRLWSVALVAWLVAWAAARGWLPVSPPAVDVLLAPAAAAMVLSAALGLAAFERDLPGYRFGWRQLAPVAAALAAVVALTPVLVASVDGRWGLPARDFRHLLSWMPEQVGSRGDFRVLWVGAPDVLPIDGWRIADGLAYASSRNGTPTVADLWPGSDQGATGLLPDALGVARRGETTRLGRLLAPLSVRYIVVPTEGAPAGQGAVMRQPPTGLLAALRSQVDLRLIRTDDALVLFENAAWGPIRAALPAGVDAHRSGGVDLSKATPALRPGSRATGSTGAVVKGDVAVGESYSSGWQLDVNGVAMSHSKAFGWANRFSVTASGTGTLSYSTSVIRYVALLFELALWIVAGRAVVLAVRRRSAAAAVVPEEYA